MKVLIELLTFTLLFNCLPISKSINANNTGNQSIVLQQIRFNPNNIDTWIWNTGIFDQNLTFQNRPGFEWPASSGHYAIFTDGLTVAAIVDSEIRMASASYSGEYAPGYISHSSGHPVAQTDSTFRFYKVSRGDNMYNNYDWQVWGRMVPYGAPYIDVNHSGIYEPAVDTPGIRGAVQTIFICLTDGFFSSHFGGEGFSGGTSPLYAELRVTSWGYDNPGYQDMVFRKFELINKNDSAWNGTYTAIIADPDLGNANDDYIGCDTAMDLAFCYNGDNNDDTTSPYAYGINPPAVGFKWLNCSGASNVGLTSVTYYTGVATPLPLCEREPTSPLQAYNMLKGLKNDQTSWVVPPGGDSSRITKYCYPGDPEAGVGWTEGVPGTPSGSIQNCGSLNGTYLPVNYVGDRKMIISSGSVNNTVHPNDTVRIIIAELIARGTNNLNSVTRLKALSQVAQHLCDNGFVIGVNNISSEIPNSYMLYQNYPNPFNPTTTIKFTIPPSKGARGMTRIVIYDVLGREIAALVNEKLNPGTYEVDWDGTNYPSGVYFYKLETDNYSETKKMVLIK
jgi:hypothetical protein